MLPDFKFDQDTTTFDMKTRPVFRSGNNLLINYGKIAWRTLLKNKFSALISITGLVTGSSGCFLIGLFIIDELAYDQHYKKVMSISRVKAILLPATNGTDTAML
jgi:putative ABC transport system permease protein